MNIFESLPSILDRLENFDERRIITKPEISIDYNDPMNPIKIKREGVENKCPYCGNTSSERDKRGNCIACGGVR